MGLGCDPKPCPERLHRQRSCWTDCLHHVQRDDIEASKSSRQNVRTVDFHSGARTFVQTSSCSCPASVAVRIYTVLVSSAARAVYLLACVGRLQIAADDFDFESWGSGLLMSRFQPGRWPLWVRRGLFSGKQKGDVKGSRRL